MKKTFYIIFLCAILFAFTGCQNSEPTTEPNSSTDADLYQSEEQTSVQTTEQDLMTGEEENYQNSNRLISVSFGENTVIYELNDSKAADSLYAQLPLTIDVEDYSTNEKIFYPPQELNTVDTPTANSGAGTLAYYESWGDVVMFYDDYNENPSLYELGQVVSGGELISQMSGTVTVEIAE